MEPPRKPSGTRLPAVEHDGRRTSNHELALDESERDFLLRIIKDQTDNVSQRFTELGDSMNAQFGLLKEETARSINENTKRILALETDRLEEVKTRLAVNDLNTSVRELLNSNRLQDQDIGALKQQIATALRPQLKADAELDGARAGASAGKEATKTSKVWSGVGVVLSVIAVSCLQYCQQQVENYRTGTAKAAPSSPAGK